MVANQKGGVGKTTTVTSLAVVFSRMGYRVGVIDMDPQSNTTSIFTKEPIKDSESITALFDPKQTVPISSLFRPSIQYDGIEILPSTIRLAAVWPKVYFQIHEYMSNIFSILGEAIKKDRNHIDDAYDYVFIDTPPSLDLPLINALSASDYIIIPILSSDISSLDGWVELQGTIENAKERLNPDLKLLGILITMYDDRVNVCKTTKRLLNERFKRMGIHVFKTIISASVEIKSVQAKRSTIITTRSNHKVSKQYEQLAKEILSIIENNKIIQDAEEREAIQYRKKKHSNSADLFDIINREQQERPSNSSLSNMTGVTENYKRLIKRHRNVKDRHEGYKTTVCAIKEWLLPIARNEGKLLILYEMMDYMETRFETKWISKVSIAQNILRKKNEKETQTVKGYFRRLFLNLEQEGYIKTLQRGLKGNTVKLRVRITFPPVRSINPKQYSTRRLLVFREILTEMIRTVRSDTIIQDLIDKRNAVDRELKQRGVK